MNITENELIQAIQDAMAATPENPSGAMTTADLVYALGINERRVLRMMRTLKENGTVEVVKIYSPNIFDEMRPRKAFALKKPAD